MYITKPELYSYALFIYLFLWIATFYYIELFCFKFNSQLIRLCCQKCSDSATCDLAVFLRDIQLGPVHFSALKIVDPPAPPDE